MGITQGKGLLVNILEAIMKKLGELKDNLATEYLSISDIIEAAQDLKDIFNQVDAKIAAATPAVKAILEKVDEAIQAMIEKAQAHIETGKAILVDLLDTIIAKIAELKDSIAGYSIFDDLLNDVLKPALKNAIENLIPTISKHLGDLADKLVPQEYVSFNEIKAKIESGEVKDNVIEFSKKVKAIIDAKITAAEPVVTAALEKVKAAIDELINKAIAEGEAAITQGKGLLVNILEAIMKKLGELKDNLATEYLSISDIIEAAQDLKDIFNQVKAKIESGEIKDSIVDFLQKLKDVVDAKIAAATPAVKAILEKIDEAIQAMIEKAKAHIETGKAILVDLLDTIIAKIAELKDSIAGY